MYVCMLCTHLPQRGLREVALDPDGRRRARRREPHARRADHVHLRTHTLTINRLTKRGKEKSPSHGHCQCQKEMDDHLMACQLILEEEPHSDTPCLRTSISFES
jgi:hypothetical protein